MEIGKEIKDLTKDSSLSDNDLLVKQNTEQDSKPSRSFSLLTLSDWIKEKLSSTFNTIDNTLKNKVNKNECVRYWEAEYTFTAGQVVIKNKKLFSSLQDDNTNNDPEEEGSVWWSKITTNPDDHFVCKWYQDLEDETDFNLLINKGLIAKIQSGGQVIDISADKYQTFKLELERRIANCSTNIVEEDYTWQSSAVADTVLKPQQQVNLLRWDRRLFYGYRLTGDITDQISNFGDITIPLTIDPNPKPGEASYDVKDFTTTLYAKLAFRIIATAVTQLTPYQDGNPIFTLQDTFTERVIYRPSFENNITTYYYTSFALYKKTCPLVNALADDTTGYCYNVTDSKYYYRETTDAEWTDLTDTINFVDDLPTEFEEGDLYVLNTEKGTKDSISKAETQTLSATTNISDITKFTFKNFYKTSCPVAETAPADGVGFYYNSSANRYYYRASTSDLWGDITDVITFADTYPSDYDDGAFFVFNNEKGKENSLYTAVMYTITGADLSVLKIANCMKLDLLTAAPTVTITASYEKSNYVGSTMIWTVHMLTTDGDIDIGYFSGDEADAPEYAKLLIEQVANSVGTLKYTHSTEEGSNYVYDGEATYLGNGTIAEDILTFNGATYSRDENVDNYNGKNYVRLPFIISKKGQESGESFGDICNQQAPEITGQVGPLDDYSSKTLSGAFYRVKGYSYDASSNLSGSGWILGFQASKSNKTYDGIKVQQSAVVIPYYIVLKSFNLEEELGIGQAVISD